MENATESKPKIPIPPPNPVDPPCQLVILQTVYHQSPGKDAVGSESRIARTLVSDEQPYVRHTRIGDSWTPLNTDWIPDPGLVVIENRGTQFRVNPTDAEKAEAARKVLLVAIRGHDGLEPIPFAVVAPGESLSISPQGIRGWRLRCASGSVPVTVSAYPR